jgi:hypothetical protein
METVPGSGASPQESSAGLAHSAVGASLATTLGAGVIRWGRRTWVIIGVALLTVGSLSFAFRHRWRAPAAAAVHGVGHGDDPSAACMSLGTSACSKCVAGSCCNEYSACQGNAACRRALETYNGCVQHPGHAEAAICSEAFGTDPNPEARSLASCAFVRVEGPSVKPGRCAGPCESSAIIDDACAAYCECMKQSCQITMKPAECPSICASLTPEQVRCRTYHCFLGAKTNPEIHCEHAVGRLNTCL